MRTFDVNGSRPGNPSEDMRLAQLRDRALDIGTTSPKKATPSVHFFEFNQRPEEVFRMK